MRKTLVVILALCCAALSNAQTTFGIKAGANLANLRASVSGISLTFDSKVGFHGGAFFTIPSGKNFSIQPEIVYSMEGAEFNFDQTSSKIALNFINLPVMFQYNASGLILEAGPQVGFLLSAKEDGIDATEGYETVNVALGFGAAYRFKQGVGLGARYNLGLSSVAKDDSQDATLKSNVFQFGLTFSLANLVRR